MRKCQYPTTKFWFLTGISIFFTSDNNKPDSNDDSNGAGGVTRQGKAHFKWLKFNDEVY